MRIERGYVYQEWTIPGYMLEALDRYVARGILPGGFLTALLENRFCEAVARADSQSLNNLPAYGRYLQWELPANCWGSPDIVAAWVQAGGQHNGVSS